MQTSTTIQRPSPSTKPTTFHLFAHLTPELRLKIWREACSQRIVTVRYNPEENQCTCSSKPPAILHTTHESRAEALRSYRLCFGTRSHPAHIYFSPYHDTLYLPRHREMGYDETLRDFKTLVEDDGGTLNQTRRVAIELIDPKFKRPWEPYNKASLLRRFPKLQEVVLVVAYKPKDRIVEVYEDMEFVPPPRVDLEMLLILLADFRHNFDLEERVLENVCRELGREYQSFTLPPTVIKSKATPSILM